jgi:hypothetical protein
MPRGLPLNPPLARNVKTDRGFHHERTGALLCPAGLDWTSIEYDLCIPSYPSDIFQGSRRSYVAEKWPFLEITGPSFSITIITTTRKILGMVFSGIFFLLRWILLFYLYFYFRKLITSLGL